MNDEASSPKRREFIKRLSVAGAGLLLARDVIGAEEPKPATAASDYRVPPPEI
jgi:hypothetical protein